MTDLLQLEDLRVEIRTPGGSFAAVDGVNLEIRRGEILGLVGESGSGKSVTALSILRLTDEHAHRTTGTIRFEGEDVLAMDSRRLQHLRGGRIAIVLQDPMTSMNPVLRIGDQLVEGMVHHADRSRAKARARSVELLREMGLTMPAAAMRGYPHQFSGGMRQRIMLAMGFSNSPALLIADEPTTALDVTIQAQILDLLRELNAEFGTAILLITHDLGVVASICTRVAVMYAGKIVEEGTAERILAAPRHPYTQALVAAVPRIDRAVARAQPLATIGGGANPLDRLAGCRFRDRCPHQMERCGEEPPLRPVAAGWSVACWLDEGRAAASAKPAAAVQAASAPIDRGAATMVEMRGISKHFPIARQWPWQRRRFVHALDDIDLKLWPGETLGLVGESGSGKSTLARLIVRLHKPSSGEILFEGEEIGGAPPVKLRPLRRHIQMVFQDPYSSLNQRLTVGHAIAEPLLLHKLVSGRQEARERVGALLNHVGLGAGLADRYPHEFSGGQRQRIGIARALAAGPRLIVADEPVSSLDVNVQAQILNLLQRLQGELGLTYVFISHNLAVVRQIAHRIVVLYLGKIVEIADAESLFSRPLHPYTRSLVASVPVPDVGVERSRPRRRLAGEMPDASNPPSGCRFRTRCPLARPVCGEVAPALTDHGSGRLAACHFPGQE